MTFKLRPERDKALTCEIDGKDVPGNGMYKGPGVAKRPGVFEEQPGDQ